jgi:hypothetical protein
MSCSNEIEKFSVRDVVVDAARDSAYAVVIKATLREDANNILFDVEEANAYLYVLNLNTKKYSRIMEIEEMFNFGCNGTNGYLVLMDKDDKFYIQKPNLSIHKLPSGVEYCRISAFNPDIVTYLIDSTVYELDLTTMRATVLKKFTHYIYSYCWQDEVWGDEIKGYATSNTVTDCQGDMENINRGYFTDNSFRAKAISILPGNEGVLVETDSTATSSRMSWKTIFTF